MSKISVSGLSKQCLCIALLCLPLLASAHRQHLSWTEVKLSDNRKSAEITYRLHQHDSTALLKSMGFDNPSLGSLEHLAVLAVYAARNTRFLLQSTLVVDAEIIGAETEGDFVYVYQEVLDQNATSEMVETSIFMDINPEQVNRINILCRGNINLLKFAVAEGAKDLLPNTLLD
jgi:hypothetical protein